MKKHLLMLLGVLVALNAYAYDFEVNGIYYNYDEDSATNSVSVTHGDNEYSGDVVIPESVTYDGRTYSVTEIGGDAFRGCSGLTVITIPNSVTTIWAFAFDGCSGLASLIIPNSVTNIGQFAFRDCSGLTSLTFSNSITYIGESAFQGCSGLISLTIPNSVIDIGQMAFSGCNEVTSVTIPSSVRNIDKCAFGACAKLKSIEVDPDNKYFTSLDGVLYSIDISKLIQFPAAKGQTFEIPNSVNSITGAFYGCDNLTSVVIPNSVTSIGTYSFHDCTSLTSVTIPNSVTSIGLEAFENCSSLRSVTIPNSVTSIGNSAFYHCSSLTSITIPNSVTSIEYFAFYGCSSLTSVTYVAEEPLECNSNIFHSTKVYENATLNYLKSAEEKIASTKPWSLFKNRIGRDADFKDDSAIAEVRNAEGETTAVYDMRGVKVGASTEGLPKGIYIVRQGSTTRKIAI